MAKKNNQNRLWVTNSKLELKGRKRLMAETGMDLALTARAPLTEQLFATLNAPDSMVVVPLGTRNRAATIFNLQQKAVRAKATLRHIYQPETKTIYAWLERKSNPSQKPASPSPHGTNGEALGGL